MTLSGLPLSLNLNVIIEMYVVVAPLFECFTKTVVLLGHVQPVSRYHSVGFLQACRFLLFSWDESLSTAKIF